jgi:hypothetical protein
MQLTIGFVAIVAMAIIGFRFIAGRWPWQS